MYIGIYDLKDYGQIKVNISNIMSKQNVSRNKLSKLTGCTYNVIDRYYQGEIQRVDLDVLARICYVLNCKISDVLFYEK